MGGVSKKELCAMPVSGHKGVTHFVTIPFGEICSKVSPDDVQKLNTIDVMRILGENGITDETCELLGNSFILFKSEADGLAFIKRLNTFLEE